RSSARLAATAPPRRRPAPSDGRTTGSVGGHRPDSGPAAAGGVPGRSAAEPPGKRPAPAALAATALRVGASGPGQPGQPAVAGPPPPPAPVVASARPPKGARTLRSVPPRPVASGARNGTRGGRGWSGTGRVRPRARDLWSIPVRARVWPPA